MGIDLTIIPDDDLGQGSISSYTRLALRMRNYDLWDALEKRSTPASTPMMWYGDEGLKKVKTNPYGQKITSVTASQFTAAWAAHVPPTVSPWDAAVHAFIAALPPDHDLFLWFH